MTITPDRQAIDVGILVSDIDRSLAFYQTILGLEKVEEIEVWFGRFHRLRFGESFVKLVDPLVPAAANRPKIEDQRGIRYLTFPVRNIDEICATCEQAGVPFEKHRLELRPGVFIAMVRDPDGTIIEFVERR
ncbi:VOC family protein [Sphingobium phenoxybenzoativorans]|uniref:VOC family protein n=1 Tax=Sphingobium phenoxybenzoativorans TaxID=1592790 RepID=UPI00087274F9|nr:VOC family protein [Sphingobium phenoxybenzoativorans]